mgnify:CR=1 FL=1
MDYRYLGRSAIKVSPLCLGAMMFGGETSEQDAKRIIDKAYDQGIDFIDTADVYHGGRSEETTWPALKNLGPKRDEVVVASKAFGLVGECLHASGSPRLLILGVVQPTLKLPQLPHLDLYPLPVSHLFPSVY